MLDLAVKYADELKSKMQSIWFDEKYKYYNSQYYYNDFEVAEDTWAQHQFVSINSEQEVIGYISYSINRQINSVYDIGIINFSDNDKLTFARDLTRAIKDVFEKFHFNKINFYVVKGNPAEKAYDKIVEKCGGRIIGVYKDHVRLIDNKMYDIKVYEITLTNYYTKSAVNLIKKLGTTV